MSSATGSRIERCFGTGIEAGSPRAAIVAQAGLALAMFDTDFSFPGDADAFGKRGQTDQSIGEADKSSAGTLVAAPTKTDSEVF